MGYRNPFKPIEKIITPTDLQMIRIRVGNGLTIQQESEAIDQFLVDLTWGTVTTRGGERRQCRICGAYREFGHTDTCAGKAVL